MRRRASLTAFALAIAACGDAGARPSARSALHGVPVDPPRPRPAVTLTATDGQPYAFAARTRGQLTFLFFGYTNCPDVCPVHAANVASVLRTLPYADRQRAQFVFVTTDPARDSLPALRAWLDHFDETFVGLTGDLARIDSLQVALGLPPSSRDTPQPDGTYGVGHAAQVLVITPDDTVRFAYGFGTRQADWAADLPILLRSGSR
jgi:protein SCO1/2